MGEDGLVRSIRYERWIWEAIKVVGGGSIAAIVPLIVTIVRVDAVMETNARQNLADLTRIEMSVREVRLEFIARDKECRDGIEDVKRSLHAHELADNERFRKEQR